MAFEYSPRLQISAADFGVESTDVWLNSLTHHQMGDDTLIVFQIHEFYAEVPRLGLALLDKDWKLIAAQPLALTGTLDNTAAFSRSHKLPDRCCIRPLDSDAQGRHAMLVLEQLGSQHYPGNPSNPVDGGTLLTSRVSTWVRVSIAPAAGTQRPTIRCTAEHVEMCRHSLNAIQAGGEWYWIGVRDRFPDGPPWHSDSLQVLLGSRLEIARDANGRPEHWHPVPEMAPVFGIAEGSSPSSVFHPVQARGYDDHHAVVLLRHWNKTRLLLVRLSDQSVVQDWPIRIARGSWKVAGWQIDPAEYCGGSIWLSTSNDKVSAKHRDHALWRIDYGERSAKRGKDWKPQAVRLSEDRAISRKSVLAYDDVALVMWEDGFNLLKPNKLRCFSYRLGARTPGTPPGWLVEEESYLIGSMPISDAREIKHFGRKIMLPAEPQFPINLLTCGGRYGAFHGIEDGPIGRKMELGEIRTRKS